MLQPLRMSRAALAGGTCLPRGPRLHFSSIAGNVGRHADRFRLPDTPCRTRFAPSPTGYLHLGSLRTALFNYLLARATGGQFVLRIEDTDQSRLVPDAEQRLYEDLRWVGLSWDEGPNMEEAPYGPYRQSERLPLYKEHAAKLLHHGKAYRCFCSPEALEQHKLAARELGEPTLYPGTCRRLSPAESGGRAAKGEPFAIRFKSAKSPTMIQDIIYSRYQKKEPEDDYIIMKRDGFPTYHFANVVDDHHMKITHVIRGAEWLISTPKHIELYQAFGWEPPLFAHVGLLVGPNRQKLSKRDNAANIAWYRDSLILPGALLNFAALLGWRGRGQYGDFMALQDMVDNFSLQFTKGDIVVNMEKLPFLQDKHFARLAEKEEDPANRSLIDSHVLQPFKAAIEEAESARKAAAAGGGGASTASSSGGPIDVASLGQRLPAPRILLDERFHKDVVRTVAAATAAAADPADRYRRAVSTLQYHIWDLGPGVLRRALVQPSSRFRHEYWRAHWSAGGMWLEAALLDLANMVGGAAVTEAAWTREALEALLREPPLTNPTPRLLRGLLGEKALYIILRWALVGSERSLPISHTMEILGREETLRRLEAARVVAEEFEAEVTAKPPRQMEGQEPPGKSGKTGK